MDSKVCPRCATEKPMAAFGIFNRGGYGPRRQSYCRPCRVSAQKATDRANPERKSAHERKMRLRKYGITPDDWALQFERQGGNCPICQTSLVGLSRQTIHVDHNHRTGAVRGILCGACNVAIGNFRDNVKAMAAAIEYVKADGCWQPKTEVAA